MKRNMSLVFVSRDCFLPRKYKKHQLSFIITNNVHVKLKRLIAYNRFYDRCMMFVLTSETYGATVQETFYKNFKLDRIMKYIALQFAC